MTYSVFDGTLNHAQPNPTLFYVISALTLFAGRQEGHPTCIKLSGRGVVMCLGQGANLHMAQLMSLPLTISCFIKIQIGSGVVMSNPGQSPEGRKTDVCVCVCFV